MSYKKFFILLTSLEIILLSIVASINYNIDPANIFHAEEYIKEVGDLLLNGKNVANVTNYDERLMQKYLIEHNNNKVDVVVLGSSRTMEITETYFPKERFFNYSVSGATLEDDIAIFYMLKDKQGLPQKVIIGLDPWILNKKHNQTRWQGLKDEYNAGVEEIGTGKVIPSLHWGRYRQLISLAYLEASLEYRRKTKKEEKKREKIFTTEEKVLDVSIIFKDGSHVNGLKFRRPDGKNYIGKYVYSLEDYDKLDEDYLQLFDRFITFLQKNAIEVIFFLPPYHPAMYDFIILRQKYHCVKDAEIYFKQYAEQHNIKVIGAYSPYDMGLTAELFHDGMHVDERYSDAWLKPLFVNAKEVNLR